MTIACQTMAQFLGNQGGLKVEWAHGRAARDEFQTISQLQRIMDKEAAVMKKHSKGKGLIGSAPFEFVETCATSKPFSRKEFKHFSFSTKKSGMLGDLEGCG